MSTQTDTATTAEVEESAGRSADKLAAAEAWVEAFAEGWRDPAGTDSFCDHFEPWLDPEIRLIQPQVPTQVGYRGFRERFARPLFDLIPDLHGKVEGWAARGDVVYITVRLEGTIGGRPVQFVSCDEVTLRDGKAVQRIAHSDTSPVLRAVLRSPSSWPRFIRTQLASRKKGP